MASGVPTFHWADYLVCALMLCLSAAIGIFYAFRMKMSTDNATKTLLTGNRKLKVFPVIMSMVTTYLSAIYILGIPTEIYVFGGTYLLFMICYLPTTVILSALFIPMFYKLGYTSAYQYLEERFSKPVRILGSLTFVVQMIIYLGVVLYTPALALSQVTGLSMHLSILSVGIVCTFYTSIGGIKAVVWTDVLQAMIIILGILVLVFKGAEVAGGWDRVFSQSWTGGRMPVFDFNPDPFVRHTFWTLAVGGIFTVLPMFGSNQATLQRYINVETPRGAQTVVWVTALMSCGLLALVFLMGLVIYTYYSGCDPYLKGRITKLDQIVMLFTMEVLSFAPGLPGLFVSCVLSAALSTLSSGLNALAAVTVCDFVMPVWRLVTKTAPPARLLGIITVAIAILYGGITIGFAYGSEFIGSTLLQIALSIFGLLGGPTLGLFLNGMLFPYVNSWGAGAGWLCSIVLNVWVGVGGIIYPAPRRVLSLSVASCARSTPFVTTTFVTTTSLPTSAGTTAAAVMTTAASVPLQKWYNLSYQHYGTLAVVVSIVVGSIVSVVTCCNRKRELDPRTVLDVRNLWRQPKRDVYDVDHDIKNYIPKVQTNESQTATDYDNPTFKQYNEY